MKCKHDYEQTDNAPYEFHVQMWLVCNKCGKKINKNRLTDRGVALKICCIIGGFGIIFIVFVALLLKSLN